MLVWVIARNYPLPDNGMQGSFELEQAKMLAKNGNEVHYLACSLHPFKKIKARGLQTWSEDNVQITVLSAFFTPRIYPFYCIKKRNKHWKKLFDEVERKSGVPDVIHVHYPAMLMIADSLRHYHERGVRVVATEHWAKVLGKKLDNLELKEYNKYTAVLDKFICVGSPLRNTVKELIGMNGEIVPNIVNDLFRPSAEKHEGYRFVAVGRLVKVKQFDKIMEAFCDCFLGQKEITLTIIGGGKEEGRLRKIIDSRQAENQVKLLGSLTRQKTAEIVSNSNSLVCFSYFETFGVPIVEAWSCGLAVVATDTAAAIIDNFNDRLGVKVLHNNIDDLKKALRRVYENREEYDKNFIVNYAVSHFSEKVVCRKLEELYRKQII